jgi:ABC-type multidrug transport system permease subunit
MAAGLLLQRSIPAYQAALVISLACWMLGGAFDLPASFGGWYEMVSRLVPHAHATELLFASYYGKFIGSPIISSIALLVMSLLAMSVATILYRQRVLKQE